MHLRFEGELSSWPVYSTEAIQSGDITRLMTQSMASAVGSDRSKLMKQCIVAYTEGAITFRESLRKFTDLGAL